MDPEDLTADERRRIQRAADDDGELAEYLVAELVDGRRAADEEDWYDVRAVGGDTKIEVKSTHRRIGDEYPADGRFRLWRAQLRSLIGSRHAGDTGTTWVAFVLFDEDGAPRVRRMHARTARELVEDTVGWGPSGHDSWDEQAKLPYDEVFSDR